MFVACTALIATFASAAYAAGDEDVFGVQPEIHHVFREAEKMPPVAFSQLFTLITLAPWLILVGGVSTFELKTVEECLINYSFSGYNLVILLIKSSLNFSRVRHFKQFISLAF